MTLLVSEVFSYSVIGGLFIVEAFTSPDLSLEL